MGAVAGGSALTDTSHKKNPTKPRLNCPPITQTRCLSTPRPPPSKYIPPSVMGGGAVWMSLHSKRPENFGVTASVCGGIDEMDIPRSFALAGHRCGNGGRGGVGGGWSATAAALPQTPPSRVSSRSIGTRLRGVNFSRGRNQNLDPQQTIWGEAAG